MGTLLKLECTHWFGKSHFPGMKLFMSWCERWGYISLLLLRKKMIGTMSKENKMLLPFPSLWFELLIFWSLPLLPMNVNFQYFVHKCLKSRNGDRGWQMGHWPEAHDHQRTHPLVKLTSEPVVVPNVTSEMSGDTMGVPVLGFPPMPPATQFWVLSLVLIIFSWCRIGGFSRVLTYLSSCI